MINRILSDGHDGDLHVNGQYNLGATSCTGNAGERTLNATLPSELGMCSVLIHQTIGGELGRMERNVVISCGSGKLNLMYPLERTYTHGAQVIPSRMWRNVYGNIAPIPWNGLYGGIVYLEFSNYSDITFNLSGVGFRGGRGGETRDGDSGQVGQQGESHLGLGQYLSPQVQYGGVVNNNQNSGGGGIGLWRLGSHVHRPASGAGGASLSDGSRGGDYEHSQLGSQGGWAGKAIIDTSGERLFLPGAGGGGGKGKGSGILGGNGGNGSGLCVLVGNSINCYVNGNGANGVNGAATNDNISGNGGGGGGAQGLLLGHFVTVHGGSVHGGVGGNHTDGYLRPGGNGSQGMLVAIYTTQFNANFPNPIYAHKNPEALLRSGTVHLID